MAALHAEPESSIAGLARKLRVHRPSASRALHALALRNLVSRDGKTWTITAEGEARLRELEADGPERVQVAMRQLGRTLNQQYRLESIQRGLNMINAAATASDRITELGRSVFAAPSRFDELARAASFERFKLPAVDDFSRSFANYLAATAALNFDPYASVREATRSLFEPTPSPIHTAIASIAEVQREQLRFLQIASPSSAIADYVASAMLPTSRMIADLAVLDSIQQRLAGGVDRWSTELTASAAAVASAHADVARMAFLDVSARFAETVPAKLPASPLIPAFTASSFVHAARGLVLPDLEPSQLEASDADFYLDVVQPFGPRFVTMWRGAWRAVDDAGPDWARQASTSGRELLIQALELLAPDAVFSQEEIDQQGHDGRPTHAMRVRRILAASSETTEEFVALMIDRVQATYRLLNAETHTRRETPRLTPSSFRGLLETIAGLLRMMQN